MNWKKDYWQYLWIFGNILFWLGVCASFFDSQWNSPPEYYFQYEAGMTDAERQVEFFRVERNLFWKILGSTIHLSQKKLLSQQIPSNKIFIKGDRKYHQIALSDILYLESYGSYVKVFLKDTMILTHETTSHFENILPKSIFMRVHKSYIVSIEKIEIIEGNRLKIGDKLIPIGNFYKKEVRKLLKG